MKIRRFGHRSTVVFDEFCFFTKPWLSVQMPAVAAGLSEKSWFHGVLPREEVVRLLVDEGDFLVRETMRHEERQVQRSATVPSGPITSITAAVTVHSIR